MLDTLKAGATKVLQYEMSTIEAMAKFHSMGRTITKGTDLNLLIDLDGWNNIRVFLENYDVVKQLVGIDEMTSWVATSNNPKHYHVCLNLTDPVEIGRRLFFQACLGSGPKREVLGEALRLAEDKTVTFLATPGDSKRVSLKEAMASWGTEIRRYQDSQRELLSKEIIKQAKMVAPRLGAATKAKKRK